MSLDGGFFDADRCTGIALGPDNSVVAVGRIKVSQDDSDAWFTGYEADGSEAFSETEGNSNFDFPNGVSVQSNGTFLVASGSGDGPIYPRLSRYGPTGDFLWDFEVPADNGEFRDVIATPTEAFLIGYHVGSDAWAHAYRMELGGVPNPATTLTNRMGWAIDWYADSNTRVLVTETFGGADKAYIDTFGGQTWSASYDDVILYDVEFDPANGDVWACGQIDSGANADDIFITHHSSTGMELDTFQLSFEDGKNERCRAIDVDGEGNVIIGGEAEITSSDYDAFVRKLSPDGDVLWSLDHDGGASGRDIVLGIAVDGGDAVWVCGTEEVPGEDQNVWVAKYLP